MTEDAVEHYGIDLLASLGYQYVYGPDLAPDGVAPERDSYRVVKITICIVPIALFR